MSTGSSGDASEERARLFRAVRDIPYYIAVEDEQDYCCVTKTLLLDRLLTTIGVESRHVLCTFRWSELPVPAEILALPHEDEDTHEFLEVHLPESERWVRVDPNWDAALRPLGLAVGEWDGGPADTAIAVPALRVYSPEESTALIAEEDEGDPAVRSEYLAANRSFFVAVNRWLGRARVDHAG